MVPRVKISARRVAHADEPRDRARAPRDTARSRAPRARTRRDAGSRCRARSNSHHRVEHRRAASATSPPSRDSAARDSPRAAGSRARSTMHARALTAWLVAPSRCDSDARRFRGAVGAPMQRVPREARALHALRELRDARERAQRSERLLIGARQRPVHQLAKLLEQLLRLGARLSLHGAPSSSTPTPSRSRTRSPLKLTSAIASPSSFSQSVSSSPQSGFVPRRVDRASLHLAEVARLPVVLENDFLVERGRRHAVADLQRDARSVNRSASPARAPRAPRRPRSSRARRPRTRRSAAAARASCVDAAALQVEERHLVDLARPSRRACTSRRRRRSRAAAWCRCARVSREQQRRCSSACRRSSARSGWTYTLPLNTPCDAPSSMPL